MYTGVLHEILRDGDVVSCIRITFFENNNARTNSNAQKYTYSARTIINFTKIIYVHRTMTYIFLKYIKLI